METLKPFFDGPRNFWRHVFQSDRPMRKLTMAIDEQLRYLSDSEKEHMEEIRTRVHAKNDLDYHYALQSLLKYWLFVHVPLTYSLLVFAGFHVVFVHAFGGF